MEEFSLSIPAKNIEARFYDKIGIVYVEGDYDKLFWAQYFDVNLFEIRKVDGCKNLEGYEDDILHHGLKCIVAKDADYSSYLKNISKHPLIVCTLSHSIECVMYCPHNVNACLKRLACSLDNHLDDIKRYYDEFFEQTKEMVVYDIANNVFGVGCSVCGDSCIPFMESNHSVKVSASKRDEFINSISSSFTKDQISQAKQWLDSDDRDMRQIMKGHFQTSFVLNLLKKMSSQIRGDKAPSISNDSLYALLITCFAECREECKEKAILKQKVNAAKAAL